MIEAVAARAFAALFRVPVLLPAAAMLLSSVTGCAPLVAPTSEIHQAAGCHVELRADVPMTLTRLRLMITAEANGQPLRLEVDTGAAGVAALSAAAVGRLALKPSAVANEFLYGFGGIVPREAITLDSLAVGAAALHDVKVDALGALRPGIDGILGLGFLARYDLDLDPAAGRLRLYRTEGCRGTVIPFAEPYVTVSLARDPFPAVSMPIKIEGNTLSALIDTGSQFSIVSKTAALRLGVSAKALAADPSVEATDFSGKKILCPIHSFHGIAIDGQSYRVLRLPVIDTSVPFDFWLGIDYLRNQRDWISFATSKMFVGRPPVAAK
jgi:predicted aspartyl protease